MSVEIKKVKADDDGMRLNRWFLKYYPNITMGRYKNFCVLSKLRLMAKEPRLR